ncbi:repressor protein [Streptococcus pyogenes]|uniref:LexA family transcriptional regulator n=1 Tax=Streptococcus pyogenes TaxID=1314 RepID=UPI00109D5140|nr:S24 family peptidase [Streptococcus pyogenes]VGU23926.1 repressor protein [Streptococcus pyogenes]
MAKNSPQDLINREIFSTNLNMLMAKKNIKQIDIHNKLGIPKSTITGYVKGRSLPTAGNVQKLADFFGVLKSDIDPRFDSNNIETNSNIIPSTLQKVTSTLSQLEHKRQLNVLDYAETQLEQQNTVEEPQATYYTYNYYDHAASAGTGQYLNDVQVETIELPVDYDADFVIPVYGDSMEPEYHSGDYVFIKLSINLSDGDIGVFEYYGDAYIKQLVINDSGAFLHSLNDKYDDILIDRDSDFRIIGEVIGSFTFKS